MKIESDEEEGSKAKKAREEEEDVWEKGEVGRSKLKLRGTRERGRKGKFEESSSFVEEDREEEGEVD